ncbi:MAG: hypothetical protein ACN6OJ_00220 [Chryseobacterium sp.]|uniref:hypothetical protein n=1 Tax=Chryseobacterium sp. TaxID=1871047 RepID=UPI003D1094B6
MNNELLYPFKNVELYLQKIDDELNSFYNSFALEAFAPRVTIDRENMQVSMLKDSFEDNEDSVQIFTFDREVGYRMLSLLADGFSDINKTLEFQRKISKSKIIPYLNTLENQITEIFTKNLLDKYTFLNQYKSIAHKNIAEYITQESKKSQKYPPLEFIAKEGENVIKKLETLYFLLADSFFISCSQEDFIKVFTGQEVGKGINWTAKSAKNTTTNKALLVYLFRQLVDQKHIKPSYISYENYYLTTIFRNNDGSKFTSQQLSSAKDGMSNNSSPQKELIDDIISQL